ncbi:MAG: hypothetical protein CL677_07685 [Bdellovibrionaceae bacterium]|nr:hypothetical protein [Pseudobdellovibrionaceae bacterium]|tara:strand:+ start:35450 stop:35908 length:459 start_codon:yes stop_codon:yes gene_type:complete
MLEIYIDADACPVKNETFKVATRYKLKVWVVANQYINLPLDPSIQMQVVSGDFDAADDWIVDNIKENDILITSDILLAERCILKQAKVIGPKGRELDEESIGSAKAARELNEHLRHLGTPKTGPSAMEKKDRSNFLNKLDQVIQAIKRKTGA